MASTHQLRTVSFSAGILFLLFSMISTQFGSAEAKILIAEVSPQAAAALRLAAATAELFAFMRPWRNMPTRDAWKSILAYGITIAAMNNCYYKGLTLMPLGLVTAIEFTGPLLVAACTSRGLRDLAAVGLAAAGIIMILPLGGAAEHVSWEGVFWSVMAAAGWAGYILFGRKAAAHGPSSAAWGLLAACAAAVPWALATSPEGTLAAAASWHVALLALIVGLTASALPYWLDMLALRAVPTGVYGVLMSLEPALGTMFGALLLGEWLTLTQHAAIAAVIAASLLVSVGRRK